MTTHLPDSQPESQPNWKHGTPTAIQVRGARVHN